MCWWWWRCSYREGNRPRGWSDLWLDISKSHQEDTLSADFADFRLPGSPDKWDPLLPIIPCSDRLGACLRLGVMQPRGHLPFPNPWGNTGLHFRAWPVILRAPELWSTYSQPLERHFVTVNGQVETRMPGCYQIKGRGKLLGEPSLWRLW